MSTWLIVWLVLTVVSIVAIGAILVAVVRQALVLSRSLGRFTEEVASLTAEIGEGTSRVSGHGGARRPTSRR